MFVVIDTVVFSVYSKLDFIIKLIFRNNIDPIKVTVKTQIRLLLKQSDESLHCLPFFLHHLTPLVYGYYYYSKFSIISAFVVVYFVGGGGGVEMGGVQIF